MSTLIFLLNSAMQFFLYVLILRFWMQYISVDYYNPFAQLVVKLTQWIVKPFRMVIPAYNNIDSATLVIIYLIACLKMSLLIYATTLNVKINLSVFLYTFLIILNAIGRLIFWILVLRAILSWLNHKQQTLELLLYKLSEPIITPIRKFIPPIGGIDVSFTVCFIILFVTNVIMMNLFVPWWAIISY